MQHITSYQSITTSQRIFEAAGILAVGILRAKRRLAEDTGPFSENRLDSSANSSVHSTNPSARGEKP